MAKTTAVVGSLLGGAAAALVANKGVLRRWSSNPDPLEGRVPAFPPGRAATITTDDGAVIAAFTADARPSDDDLPHIVLIHGLTSNHDDMGPIAERLVEAGFSVTGIDQRGHGASTIGSEGFGGRRLGADLAQLLVALDLTNVVLAGHSMGGMAIMNMLVDEPELTAERIRANVLIATSAAMDGPRNQLALRLGSQRPSDLIHALKKRLVVAAGLSIFGKKPSLFMIEQALESATRCSDETRRCATEGLLDHDVTGRLHQVSTPTVVAAGDHDKLTPLEDNRQIASAISGAELVVLAGAGHQVIWEFPDRLAAIIAKQATTTDLRSTTA